MKMQKHTNSFVALSALPALSALLGLSVIAATPAAAAAQRSNAPTPAASMPRPAGATSSTPGASPSAPAARPGGAGPVGTTATGANGTTSSAANGRPTSGEYRLGAGDRIRIEVYKDPELSGEMQIRPDGKITLAFVGDITASGKTPLELDDAVTNALKEYVNNPQVTVVVVQATAATAYVLGEVARPGSVPVNGDMNVLQVLSLAGGVTEWAKTKNIRILRPGPNGTTERIPVNYADAMDGKGKPVYLRPGDTLVVPDR
jgi:polysaccharide export outer membrane protein